MLVRVCLMLSVAVPAAAQVLSIDLGPTNRENGLAVPSAGDGVNRPVEFAGRAGREIAGPDANYLYVRVDDRAFPPGDYTAYVTLDLYDDAPGLVGLQYDSVGDPQLLGTHYQPAERPVVLAGSGRWVRRTVRLTGARMAGGQNHQADFRLEGRAIVARIEVTTTPPAGFDPDQPIPADELEQWRCRIGEGMKLTFGGECDDALATLFELLGVTAVESYVTWETVEDAARGTWDWSRWDAQVRVLQAHGLKWVPFLIAGPAYATPRWFREGPKHHPYRCLEHGLESKVESLWNPALPPEIERFLRAFAERYADTGVIQSLLLGVTGIYGESIYPAGPEGGWTADIPGPYHNHGGWWAGDDLAQVAFRGAMQARYESIARLNAAWGTRYADFTDVTTWHPDQAPSPAARADFVTWYEQAMTDWSRWWVEATRRAFPETPIMLCTGGDGAPYLGADFTAQAKAIAPYGAGIRITNEGSDYAANFAVTREVATATRFYGTFCGFEPASRVDPAGIAARIYNATASGADELHFYTPNVLAGREAVAVFRRNAGALERRQPPVPKVAVYLPRAAWAQDGARVAQAYELVRQLREIVDLDLVNATSVADGVLRDARALFVPYAPELEPAAAEAIEAFARGGGLVVRQADDAPGEVLRRQASEPAPLHFRLDVGSPGDEPFLAGDWFHPETGAEFPTPGARKRWSGARPIVLLPATPGRAASLEIEAVLRAESLPAGADCKVRLDGALLGTLHVGHGVYRFELRPEQLRRTPCELTFEPTTWCPADHGSTDERRLGVMLSRVELTADAGAPPAVNTGLAFAIDWDSLPLQTVGQGRIITLPALVAGDAWPTILTGLLAGDAARGLPVLREDEAFDRVFVTAVDGGRLWLNMNPDPVVRGGVTVPGYGIAQSP